jgi:hypothetical protein
VLAERAAAGEQVSAVANAERELAAAEAPESAATEDPKEREERLASRPTLLGEVVDLERGTPATPLSVVGALTVLIERMAELSEGFLPEILAAQPQFDALDLIDLAKRLSDFADAPAWTPALDVAANTHRSPFRLPSQR